MKNLAPAIHRQRLVIEGTCPQAITSQQIKSFLLQLSTVLEMTTLIEPVTHCSDLYGWAGWIHWENSGAHFYAWERPLLFFSVDIYTCKAFDVQKAVAFAREYFSSTELEYQSF